MNLPSALNIVLGSCVVAALIFIDYARKYNTDSFQRNLFLNCLVFTLMAMASDFIFYLFLGVPGKGAAVFLRIALTGYYFFQILLYYHIALFVDYLTFNDQQRTSVMRAVVWIINAAHLVIILLNFKWPLYYFLTDDNFFKYSDFYFVRLIISYIPALFTVIDAFFLLKNSKLGSLALLMSFVILTAISSIIDLVFHTDSVIWPFLVCSELYTYFFTIQNDLKIDSLTGLGNRNSFNEFIKKIAAVKEGTFHIPFRPRRRKTEAKKAGKKKVESYSIVMIDMDHFKAINDTLGHLEGDNALRDMARAIKNSVRQSDFAARYGGDEFVLAARSDYDITILLDRIQSALDEMNAKNERPYKLQMSYGYDTYTVNSGEPINTFLKHIDGLMYKNKNERRRSSDRGNSAEHIS